MFLVRIPTIMIDFEKLFQEEFMASRILKFLAVIILLIFVVFAGAYIYMSSCGKPMYNGEVVVTPEELGAEVTVYRDENGIPHVEAKTEKDAYFAVGYIHAQERLFQMQTFRLYSQGRLSELTGEGGKDGSDKASTLEKDKFFRVLGFKHLGELGVDALDKESRELLESYTAGVNHYIHTAKSLPPEFLLIGKPDDWKVSDSLTFGRLIAWFLSHNYDREVLRQRIIADQGVERGWELLPRHPSGGPYIIEPSVKKYDPRGKVIETAPLPLPADIFSGEVAAALMKLNNSSDSIFPDDFSETFGSNNWVVDGTRTKSGAPILSNDPHLEHMLPSIFFELHIKTQDGLDAIGVGFPSMPFLTLGHNRNIAWGATTTRADTQDLFVEKVNPENPDQYLHNGEWKDFIKREEVFKIKERKGFREEKIIVRSTIHGPIINDIIHEIGPDAPPVALAWTGQTVSNDVLGFFNLSRAGSASDVKAALSQIGQPIQNWIYADVQGNIGYFASGFYPLRAKGDGTLPVPGWTGEYDWNEFVPYEELPQLDNPSDGMIVTANNNVVPEEDYPYIVSFNYAYYRANRIRQLLTAKEKLTPEDMTEIQHDRHSLQGERIAKYFVNAFNERGDKNNAAAVNAAKILEGWDYSTAADKAGPAVFIYCYKAALELMLNDEVSTEALARELISSQASQGVYDLWIEKGDSPFFDDRNTDGVEDRDAILAKAVEIGAKNISERLGDDPAKWKWGAVHKIPFVHALAEFKLPGTEIKPLSVFFPAYHVESAGSHDTVFLSHFGLYGKDFTPTVGPCFRQVIDMSDIEGARMVIDTGQSGHPKSSHLFDQNNKWLYGDYLPMKLNMDDLKKENSGVLKLIPK